jgi:hypothetical protein
MNRTRIPLNKQLLGGLFVGLLALLLLPPGGAGAQTLAQHCGQWSIVPSPSPGSMDILEGIAAISPQDVWTVGDYIGTQGFNQVLIERWNGKRWINVPSPNPGQKLPTRGRGRLFHRCLGGRRHQFSELGRPRHLD